MTNPPRTAAEQAKHDMTPDDVVEKVRELVRMLVEDGDVEPDAADDLVAKLVPFWVESKH